MLIILEAKYNVKMINANTQARRQRTLCINCDQNSTKSTPLLSLPSILTESRSNKNKKGRRNPTKNTRSLSLITW